MEDIKVGAGGIKIGWGESGYELCQNLHCSLIFSNLIRKYDKYCKIYTFGFITSFATTKVNKN